MNEDKIRIHRANKKEKTDKEEELSTKIGLIFANIIAWCFLTGSIFGCFMLMTGQKVDYELYEMIILFVASIGCFIFLRWFKKNRRKDS